MSESTFPFDQPVAATELGEEATSEGRSRNVVVGGLAAAVLVAAGGFFLLGGEEPVEDASPVRRAPVAAAPGGAEVPTVEVVPAAATEMIGRNPFKARYVAPAAAPAQPQQPAQPDTSKVPDLSNGFTLSPDGSGGVVVKPGTSTGGAPLPGSTGSTGGRPAPVAPAPASSAVTLVRGEEKDGALVAVFAVDGTPTTVKVGETFGSRKQVLLVSLHEGPGAGQWTAVLRVGDASPKDVVSGETIHVTS